MQRLISFTCVLAGAAFVFAGFGSSFAVSQPTADFIEWIEEKEAFYEAHPELKETRGSGWKPYNRAKWFVEQRMTDGELPPLGARWDAWQYKRELEARTAGSGGGVVHTWFSLGPTNFSGRILAIDVDPNDTDIVYVGAADGGVWKTTNAGQSWTPTSDELPSIAVGGVAVSKTVPDLVVMGTGEATSNAFRVTGIGILRSTDGAATWEETSLTLARPSGHGFHVVEAGPNGTFLAGATDGLWRSSDDGVTWDQVMVGGNFYDVKWKPGDPNTVYTVKGSSPGGNNVKISTDDGMTWTKLGTGQPPSIKKSKIAVTPADDQMIYAFFGENSIGVYRTTDGGATWTLRSSQNLVGQQGWYNVSLACDPDDPERVIAGGIQLYGSTNGGLNFLNIGSGVHVDHHAAVYEPGSTSALWVGSDGGVWRSTNDGNSWNNRNSGLVTFQFYDVCVNNGAAPYFVMGGTQDNGTNKWSGTTTWSYNLGGDGMICNVDRTMPTRVYAEIQFGVQYRSLNSGAPASFSPINNGLPTANGPWVTPVVIDPSDGTRLFVQKGGLHRTEDAGASWHLISTHSVAWIDVSLADPDIVWTGSGRAWYSLNEGDTWTECQPWGILTGGFQKIHAHPTDTQSALVCFGGYSDRAHVALTTDFGQTWQDRTGNLPDIPVNDIVVDPSVPDNWFVGTDIGVWWSSDSGTTWIPFEVGLPNAYVIDVEIADSERKLVAATHGRGMWEIDIPLNLGTDAPVSVAPAVRNLMFDEPWPNPVTDRTLFRYAAKSDAPVTLRVYDVQGRLVSDLEELAAGDGIIRTTPWLTDDVPSGVYFAVLRAGGEQESRKVIVAK